MKGVRLFVERKPKQNRKTQRQPFVGVLQIDREITVTITVNWQLE